MEIQNPWLNTGQKGKKVRSTHLEQQDLIIVERYTVLRLVKEMLRVKYDKVENLKILDLGCGDGICTEYLAKEFPNNDFLLIDGSKEMIDKAKTRLVSIARCQFQVQSFEEYSEPQLTSEESYDFIFSSTAIHHIDKQQKLNLNKAIYQNLKKGGCFLNFDVVKPASPFAEEIQDQLWINWMNRMIINYGQDLNVGDHDHIPKRHSEHPINQPCTLLDNLSSLEEAGFQDVDCFYKYSVFALFGGFKN